MRGKRGKVKAGELNSEGESSVYFFPPYTLPVIMTKEIHDESSDEFTFHHERSTLLVDHGR